MPKNKHFSKREKIKFGFIALALSLLIVLFFGEIMLRGYRYLQSNKTPAKTMIPDEKLGWKAAENYHFNGSIKDAAGHSYAIDLLICKQMEILFTDVTQRSNLVGEHPSVLVTAGGSAVHCLSGASLLSLAFLFLFLQCKKKAPGRDVSREALFCICPDNTFDTPAGGFLFLRKKKQKRFFPHAL